MRNFLFGCVLWLSCVSGLQAAIETYDFADDMQRARYQQLSQELRCPKCQNQNLADSDSQIAADLRKELHAQLLAGKSDEAIIEFMRERYGDFVLYKPRVQRNTLLLWLGPLGLVLVVLGGLWWSRRAPANAIPSASGAATVAGSGMPAGASTRLSPRLANLVSALAVLLVAIGSLLLYRHLGSMQALQITELANTVFAGQLSPEEQQRQQDQLLVELDGWLALHPEQEKFVYMRARLLAETEQWERAAADYRELLSRFPDQDNLLAEYAQVLFLQQQRVLGKDAAAFLQQALSINPHNMTALGLLGMHAFEQGDYRNAVEYWQRLAQSLPPHSPQAETIRAGIAQARELGGLPEPAAAGSAGDVRLQVQVTVAGESAARPEETVFVFLRAVNGPRMPLAAVRTTVAALAQPVVLDTATSPMRAQLDLAAIEQFEVVARLSRSGQPQAAAGDWEGVLGSLDRQQLAASAVLDVQISKAFAP